MAHIMIIIDLETEMHIQDHPSSENILLLMGIKTNLCTKQNGNGRLFTDFHQFLPPDIEFQPTKPGLLVYHLVI